MQGQSAQLELSFDPLCMEQLDNLMQPVWLYEILITEQYELVSPQHKAEADKVQQATTFNRVPLAAGVAFMCCLQRNFAIATTPGRISWLLWGHICQPNTKPVARQGLETPTVVILLQTVPRMGKPLQGSIPAASCCGSERGSGLEGGGRD